MTLLDDLKRGLKADTRTIITGTLIALLISVPLILVLAAATSLPDLLAGGIGVLVQLVAGYVIAGRLARRGPPDERR